MPESRLGSHKRSAKQGKEGSTSIAGQLPRQLKSTIELTLLMQLPKQVALASDGLTTCREDC